MITCTSLKGWRGITRSLIDELNKGVVEIITATSGQEALRIIDDHKVDLLITDNIMQEMNGIELLRFLEERIDIRKVLLSFETLQTQDRVKIAYAGADEVLSKPVDEIRLRGILDRYL